MTEIQAIVVPADTGQPCTAIAIPAGEWEMTLTRLIGPLADRAVYDRDAALWLGGDGADQLPPNRRATRYVFGHSEAGAHNRTDPDNPPYWLHGTVLITGPEDEPPGDAPARLHVLFGVARREAGA